MSQNRTAEGKFSKASPPPSEPCGQLRRPRLPGDPRRKPAGGQDVQGEMKTPAEPRTGKVTVNHKREGKLDATPSSEAFRRRNAAERLLPSGS